MLDYTKTLPVHIEKYVGENDLFLEIYEGIATQTSDQPKPPLLFVHGAFTGSWMWSKYIPHFVNQGFSCYVMNLRSHYKSRSMDMTKITFEDYMHDVEEMILECGQAPIVIGFSMGGMLCQKIAESNEIAGLVLIDSCISKEVNDTVPYINPSEETLGIVLAAPTREEESSMDESFADILFQRKYLSMESSKALGEIACWIKGNDGMSINYPLITCPCLVVKAVQSENDEKQGRATADYLAAEYQGLWGTTHTGLLVGQRYGEVVDIVLSWLEK